MPRSNLVPIVREPTIPTSLKWILGKYEAKKFMTSQEARKKVGMLLGISPDTYAQKKNHPERFTYQELLKLVRFFGFSDEEILEVMR